MDLQKTWQKIVKDKNSLLCVGLDPAEFGQRDPATLKEGEDKLTWSLELVKAVAPFASAIKPNRNYYKDFSRQQMQELTRAIHSAGMIAIDDAKIADIGSTVDAGIYHTSAEGFDAVTFAPFAGNTEEASASAMKHSVALINLVLMSNPEFATTKDGTMNGKKGFAHLASESAKHAGVQGIVIGAPSESNHITSADIEIIKSHVSDKLVLMPGIGAQGGDAKKVLDAFGDNVIVNVGRAIFQSDDPAKAAETYRDQINSMRQH